MAAPDLTPLARALGRVPSGLFVVTTVTAGRRTGFLASFLQQVGFEPPVVVVAVGRDRPVLADFRASGRFAVSVIDESSKRAVVPFTRRLAPGESPFDQVTLLETPSGQVALAEALAWIECRVIGELTTGDHVLVAGEAVAGELRREGDPLVHLRKNGLSY